MGLNILGSVGKHLGLVETTKKKPGTASLGADLQKASTVLRAPSLLPGMEEPQANPMDRGALPSRDVLMARVRQVARNPLGTRYRELNSDHFMRPFRDDFENAVYDMGLRKAVVRKPILLTDGRCAASLQRMFALAIREEANRHRATMGDQAVDALVRDIEKFAETTHRNELTALKRCAHPIMKNYSNSKIHAWSSQVGWSPVGSSDYKFAQRKRAQAWEGMRELIERMPGRGNWRERLVDILVENVVVPEVMALTGKTRLETLKTEICVGMWEDVRALARRADPRDIERFRTIGMALDVHTAPPSVAGKKLASDPERVGSANSEPPPLAAQAENIDEAPHSVQVDEGGSLPDPDLAAQQPEAPAAHEKARPAPDHASEVPGPPPASAAAGTGPMVVIVQNSFNGGSVIASHAANRGETNASGAVHIADSLVSGQPVGASDGVNVPDALAALFGSELASDLRSAKSINTLLSTLRQGLAARSTGLQGAAGSAPAPDDAAPEAGAAQGGVDAGTTAGDAAQADPGIPIDANATARTSTPADSLASTPLRRGSFVSAAGSADLDVAQRIVRGEAGPEAADHGAVSSTQPTLQHKLAAPSQGLDAAVEAFLDDWMRQPQAPGRGAPPFESLDADVRRAYEEAAAERSRAGRPVSPHTLYLEQATASATDVAALDRQLQRHGLSRMPNDGNGANDCLLIALLQHATGDYTASHEGLVGHYRKRLAAVPELDAAAGEPLIGNGPAARQLVDMLNENPDLRPKLEVALVSMVDGVPIEERIPAPAGEASRTVLIVDQGGHFEAVSALRPEPRSAVATRVVDAGPTLHHAQEGWVPALLEASYAKPLVGRARTVRAKRRGSDGGDPPSDVDAANDASDSAIEGASPLSTPPIVATVPKPVSLREQIVEEGLQAAPAARTGEAVETAQTAGAPGTVSLAEMTETGMTQDARAAMPEGMAQGLLAAQGIPTPPPMPPALFAGPVSPAARDASPSRKRRASLDSDEAQAAPLAQRLTRSLSDQIDRMLALDPEQDLTPPAASPESEADVDWPAQDDAQDTPASVRERGASRSEDARRATASVPVSPDATPDDAALTWRRPITAGESGAAGAPRASLADDATSRRASLASDASLPGARRASLADLAEGLSLPRVSLSRNGTPRGSRRPSVSDEREAAASPRASSDAPDASASRRSSSASSDLADDPVFASRFSNGEPNERALMRHTWRKARQFSEDAPQGAAAQAVLASRGAVDAEAREQALMLSDGSDMSRGAALPRAAGRSLSRSDDARYDGETSEQALAPQPLVSSTLAGPGALANGPATSAPTGTEQGLRPAIKASASATPSASSRPAASADVATAGDPAIQELFDVMGRFQRRRLASMEGLSLDSGAGDDPALSPEPRGDGQWRWPMSSDARVGEPAAQAVAADGPLVTVRSYAERGERPLSPVRMTSHDPAQDQDWQAAGRPAGGFAWRVRAPADYLRGGAHHPVGPKQ